MNRNGSGITKISRSDRLVRWLITDHSCISFMWIRLVRRRNDSPREKASARGRPFLLCLHALESIALSAMHGPAHRTPDKLLQPRRKLRVYAKADNPPSANLSVVDRRCVDH